ncbi:MAG: hypothetical protein KIT00_01025 [Rhodospirillales bacterium]|nr:hypothetical protein [Rhodospirillales bacterium]
MRYVFLMVVLAFSFMTDGVAETRSFGGTGGEVHILTTDDREIGFVNSTPPFACSHFHIVTARDTYLGGPRVVYRCYLYQAGTQREGGRDWKHYVFGPEQVAFPRTTAGAPSLAGTWQGTWKNSSKKSGQCTFTFTEHPGGVVVAKGSDGFGTWQGTRKGNVITMATHGANHYLYRAVVTIRDDGKLGINYQGHDPTGKRAKGPNWTGRVELTK